jgi:hypothetical protein
MFPNIGPRPTDSVVSLVTVLLSETHSPAIVDQACAALRAEYTGLAGFVAGDVLLSTDGKTLTVVTLWRDVHAWSLSRYDPGVGEVLESFFINSTSLSFELYHTKAHFSGLASGRAETALANFQYGDGVRGHR